MSDRSEQAGYLAGLDPNAIEWVPQIYTAKGHSLTVQLPHLNSEQIADLASHVARQSKNQLKSLPLDQIVDAIDRTIARLLDRNDPYRRKMDELLPIVTGYAPEIVALGLTGYLKTFRKPQLKRFLAEDFANPSILDQFQPLMKGGCGRAFSPDLSAHIWAGNVPGLPIWSLISSLLVKSGTIGKVSTAEPLFAGWFAQLLAEVEPALADCLAVIWWQGGDVEREAALVKQADLILGYGSNESLQSIHQRVPVNKRFLAYGHKVSFSMVATEALTSNKAKPTARLAAYDIARYDQQGCYSPQMIFVEQDGNVSPERFAHYLSQELSAFETKYPRRELGIEEAGSLATWRSNEELTSSGTIFGEETGLWTVSYQQDDQRFLPSSLNRTIRVIGVNSLKDVPNIVAPFKSLLQTVGIASNPERLYELASILGAVGVTRICALGDMTSPEAGWHHDGRFNLLDLVTITEIDARAETASDRLASYVD